MTRHLGLFGVVSVLCILVLVSACGAPQPAGQVTTHPAPTASGSEHESPPVAADASVAWQPGGISLVEFGERAYSYIPKLAVETRSAGTAAESVAAARVMGWFRELGYSPSLQSFTYTSDDGKVGTSQNVVVFRGGHKVEGTPVMPLVIIGAHYDSNGDGLGADDNASGISLVLELAERLRSYDLPYDVIFVAFGGEELAGKGSEYYVQQMSTEDILRTTVMINFDSLIFGDKLYIHSGSNGKTGPRDQMLEIVREFGLPVDLGGWPPTGVIPEGYSDHHFFNEAGIPVVFCLSTNWALGRHDGRTQTEKYGTIWADEEDNLATIEQRFPGRPLQHLKTYAILVFEYLKRLGAARPSPAALSFDPPPASTAVSVGTVVSTTFDEPMDPSTLNPSTFYLVRPGQGPLLGAVTYDSATRTVRLSPRSPLDLGVTYQVVLTDDVKANNGMGLVDAPLVWSFSTELSSEGFSDLTDATPYGEAITELARLGIVSGFGDGAFHASAPVSRQQFAKMIVKTLGLPVTGSEVCPFIDVSSQIGSDPFYPSRYVAVCALHGIIKGKTQDSFVPDAAVTREQLVTMVYRAADLPPVPSGYIARFVPALFSTPEHYRNAVTADYYGLLSGLHTEDSFLFRASASRGEACALLYALLRTQS